MGGAGGRSSRAQALSIFYYLIFKPRRELEKRFTGGDKNKDGKLTADEAKAMPRVSRNFDRIDKNKLGFALVSKAWGRTALHLASVGV
jgi:hypothetical protein